MRRRFAQWLEQYRVPVEALGVYRIVYAAYMLFLGTVPSYVWLTRAPASFFDPPTYSLAVFVDGFPHPALFYALSLAIPVGYLLLMLGYRTRVVCLLLFASLIVGDTFAYSLGKIDHDRVLHAYLVLIMAFSPWGDVYSLDERRRRPASRGPWRSLANAWPVAMVALVIGFGYFSAGIGKALRWLDLDPVTQGARRWLIHGVFVRDRQAYLSDYALALEAPVLWEMMDVVAVLFEVGFLFAVLHISALRAFAVAAVGFHFANYLILQINFSGLYILYLLFIPWRLVLPYITSPAFERAIQVLLRPVVYVVLLMWVLGAGLYAVFWDAQVSYEGFTPWISLLGRPGPWYPFVTFGLGLVVIGLIGRLYVRGRRSAAP